jgi:hypothetical protein
MKKIYTRLLPVIALLFFAGCSKDAFKSYDKRILGSWTLVGVDRRGFGGDTGSLPFQEGQFVFDDAGSLTYTNAAGTVYKGSWNIDRQWVRGTCTTYDDGYTNCADREVKNLFINAIDFAGQDLRSEHFDEIWFTGTNHFKAYIYSGLHSYVFHVSRN